MQDKIKYIVGGLLITVALLFTLSAQNHESRRPYPSELDTLVDARENIQDQLGGTPLHLTNGVAGTSTNLNNHPARIIFAHLNQGCQFVVNMPNATSNTLGRTYEFRNLNLTNWICLTNATQYIITTNAQTLQGYRLAALKSCKFANVTGTNWWMISTPP